MPQAQPCLGQRDLGRYTAASSGPESKPAVADPRDSGLGFMCQEATTDRPIDSVAKRQLDYFLLGSDLSDR